MNERIAVLGLGYVGLPLTLSIARHFADTVGFDVNAAKVQMLVEGGDPTSEGLQEAISSTRAKFSADPEVLCDRTFIVVGVPTPIDERKQPDLQPLKKACELVGPRISSGCVVVFESTVYPGLTEEFCGGLLEKYSGLKAGRDFFLGYSPERINPGDKEHSLEQIIKVIAADSDETLARLEHVYGSCVAAGVYKAPSIRVAEAAKVIENTQRDLNIALMNELAIIFDRLGINSKEVLEAARTKWNFLSFTPGLVGGHCIGVDPYYLTAKAQEVGYHPQVILAGRRINDEMGIFIAQRLVKLLCREGIATQGAKVGILGITFKENISDTRNSRVPDIARELEEYGVMVSVVDPHADPAECEKQYGVKLVSLDSLSTLDALIYAVPHHHFEQKRDSLLRCLRAGGVLMDVKSRFDHEEVPAHLSYWSL